MEAIIAGLQVNTLTRVFVRAVIYSVPFFLRQRRCFACVFYLSQVQPKAVVVVVFVAVTVLALGTVSDLHDYIWYVLL